jgi:polyphenol oxidase
LRFGVRNADGDASDAEGRRDFCGFAGERHGRSAALLAYHLEIDPANAAAPSSAERFHGRFLGGETSGVAFEFVLEALAISDFVARVDAAQERLAVALDGRFDARNFCNIHTHANDQETFLARERPPLANCDYTYTFMAANKGSRARRKIGKKRKPLCGSASRWTQCVQRGVRVLQVPELAKLPWLVHGFSTRVAGVSKRGGKRVLNLGFTEWDARENVKQNRRRLQSALGAQDLHLVTLLQFHSDTILSFESAPTEPSRGDASVTKTAGLLLAVQTADCVPILLVDPKNRAVAVVHAGWRGTLARIVEKTIGRMQMQFASKAADLLAAIGPAIGGCCYEVGTEVAAAFSGQFANAADFFDELRTGDEPNPLQWLNMMPPGHQPPAKKVLLDLRKANRAQLQAAGVPAGHIFVSDLCTACRQDLLFSYRKEGAESGRMMAVIGIRTKEKRAAGR